jgi:hypothetical protein
MRERAEVVAKVEAGAGVHPALAQLDQQDQPAIILMKKKMVKTHHSHHHHMKKPKSNSTLSIFMP